VMSKIAIPFSGKRGAGKYFIIDEEDLPKVIGYRWFLDTRPKKKKDGTVSSYVYERVKAFKKTETGAKTLYLHRVIAGVTDPKMDVNHINRNVLDNTRANLEVLPHAEHARLSSKVHKKENKCVGLSATSTSGTETSSNTATDLGQQ
jgi:hypothetical protein